MADNMEYLQTDFDPASITMPRLRNMLMTHDILYPASAKKTQLVDIFNQELKPRARKLLAARDKVRRTSKGITDMPSSQEGTIVGDNEDRDSMPPPPAPKVNDQRKSRKGERSATDDAVSGLSGDKASRRRISSKHARQSDTETEPESPKRPAARKSRKSTATPELNHVGSREDLPVRPPMRSGPFSDENPFQSGSSPLTEEANRRKSAGTSIDRKKSSSRRRKTDGAPLIDDTKKQNDGATASSSRTFQIPMSPPRQLESENELFHGLEAGEEFEPRAQDELALQIAANGKKDVLPPRPKRRSQQSTAVPTSAPWLVLLTLLAGYATWYRQEKLLIGYCGVGRPPSAMSSMQLPEWATAFQPECESCPQHAICYEGMKTQCEDDFVSISHPLSFGGLIPLPPSCEPDGEKVRRVKAVADRAVEELRDRKAQAECGTLKNVKGGDDPAQMDEQELKTAVGRKRRKNMDTAEFEDLWKGALGEMVGREEVVSSADGSRLASISLARLPISCAVKRSARLTLARYRGTLSVIVLLLSLAAYARIHILTARSDTARVPSLVATTLDRLATQAALHVRGDAIESWISVGQLRDDVLRDEFSDKRREGLWKRVAAVVERNANVRASVREGRGGDVSRVWEWIGSVGLIDEPYSGRRSGGGKRVSFGGLAEDFENATHDMSPSLGGGRGKDVTEQRKWDEGRPLY